MDQMIGKTIDSYKILEILGRGGMGVVYKAQDTTLDRDVALKMMDILIASDPNFLKRFQSEAKALAKLHNPNIVSIFALRQTEFGVCIVMEFVKGKTLAEILKQSVLLPIPRVIYIFRQLLTALDHAHRGGVIHRDIKPGNVMLTEGDVVKVTDFGLAKIQKGTVSTVTMGTAGTLYYMSPEQIRGLGQVDHRGDIYSAGMALYECLTGRVPFRSEDSDFAVAQMIVEGRIPPPDKLNAALPKDLVRIVMKSIDKDPAKRFQSAAEMATALERFGSTIRPGDYKVADAATMVVTPPGAEIPPKLRRKPAPLRLYAVVGGVCVVLLITYFVVWPLVFPDEGAITVTTTPSRGKVFIDDVPVNRDPVENYAIAAGRRMVSVRWPQSKLDTPVTVEGGKLITLALHERQPAGSLHLPQDESVTQAVNPNSTPGNDASRPGTRTMTYVHVITIPKGSVMVDGGPRRSAEDGVTISVEPGTRTVVFTDPESNSRKETQVTVKAGETRDLKCYFRGRLHVSFKGVPWASITLDGKDLGQNYGLETDIPSGPHQITVKHESFEVDHGTRQFRIEPKINDEPSVQLEFKFTKK